MNYNRATSAFTVPFCEGTCHFDVADYSTAPALQTISRTFYVTSNETKPTRQITTGAGYENPSTLVRAADVKIA